MMNKKIKCDFCGQKAYTMIVNNFACKKCATEYWKKFTRALEKAIKNNEKR